MDPLHEYKYEQTSFKVLIIITGIMFFAMAVFLTFPEDDSIIFIWGMRIFLVLMGVLVFVAAPQIRVRAFSDYIEIIYGPTKLVSFKLENSKITDIRAVEYSPLKDFGGYGIKGGTGKWKGWWAFTVSGSKEALSIETTEKNYLINCPDPKAKESVLKGIVGIK